MARTRPTKRSINSKQQEAVRRQQSRTVAFAKEMRMVKSTKEIDNKRPNVKIKLLLRKPFEKNVKKDESVIREMTVRCQVVFPLRKKAVYYNYINYGQRK